MILAITVNIEIYVLFFGESQGVELPAKSSEARRRDLGAAKDFRSDRKLPLGKVTDDMTLAGFV